MARRGATTKIIDHGWNALVKRLKITKGNYTKVGVQLGTVRKPTKDNPGGQTMAEIAAANEFGTSKIPERSFIRSTRDKTREKLNRIIEGEQGKLLRGETTPRRSLALIGLWMEQQIKATIRSNVNPPNAPSTVRRKQKNKPGPVKTLIDSGQLHQSIRHVEVMH